ncbi:MAG: peptidoglycan DD-metalloendopeptidase family protein [Chloroflexi bacterium]|nr:peptidoglycan DD-metalloendopeptidase family protein [Chloroflexota bacterium]
MERSRIFVIAAILAVIVLAALLLSPGDGGAGISVLSDPLSLSNGNPQPVEQVAPTVEPTSTPNNPGTPVFASPVDEPTRAPSGEPTPTPQSVFAQDLPSSGGNSPAGDTRDGGVQSGWNPPQLEVPISRHPWDHYWFIRPVGSDQNNISLFFYPYGSNGPGDNLRVHRGIDLANPIGVEVFAAATGTVIWSDKGHVNQFETITSYGNTVVIEHDIGLDGKKIYTLYAHLSAMFVRPGDRVNSGDVIGLIGATGQVSGPHVHFEVRVGENSDQETRNPEMWIAPFAGSGVVAGRIEDGNGEALQDVDVELFNLNRGYVTHRTTTYASTRVNGADYWNENFALADVPQGNYIASFTFGAFRFTGEVMVLPGTTNWVEMGEIEELSPEELEEDEDGS